MAGGQNTRIALALARWSWLKDSSSQSALCDSLFTKMSKSPWAKPLRLYISPSSMTMWSMSFRMRPNPLCVLYTMRFVGTPSCLLFCVGTKR